MSNINFILFFLSFFLSFLMNKLPRLPRIFIENWAAARYSAADSILWLTQVPAADYELRLIISCSWLEFWWLDKSCSLFYPAADSSSGSWVWVAGDSITMEYDLHNNYSSSGGWIGVVADSITRLTRVPAAGYELWLTQSCGWRESRQLDTSCGWFYPTTDSSSDGWIWVAADSILRLIHLYFFLIHLYFMRLYYIDVLILLLKMLLHL